MPAVVDKVRSGVAFEENVIGFLTKEIIAAVEVKSLPDKKRRHLIELLETLAKDSVRHKQLLEQIAIKY